MHHMMSAKYRECEGTCWDTSAKWQVSFCFVWLKQTNLMEEMEKEKEERR